MTKPTTNNVGIPVASDNDSLTVGAKGPVLLQDHYLIEKNAQFNRERVPERVVHAKGGGVPAGHPHREPRPVLHGGR